MAAALGCSAAIPLAAAMSDNEQATNPATIVCCALTGKSPLLSYPRPQPRPNTFREKQVLWVEYSLLSPEIPSPMNGPVRPSVRAALSRERYLSCSSERIGP